METVCFDPFRLVSGIWYFPSFGNIIEKRFQRRTMSVLDLSQQQVGAPQLENIQSMLNHYELFRAECRRLMLETDKACEHMHNDNVRRLDQKFRDVQFLRTQLELKLDDINLEVDALVTLQSRVVKALENCKEPLRVTNLCLEERKKHAENLHDKVNTELLKEKHVLEELMSHLEHVGKQISEQIRLNHSVKYHLEKDLKEKSEAQNIDDACALMTVHSTLSSLQMPRNNNTALPSLTFPPKQWENISDLNINKAEQEKSNSESLQASVESVLQESTAKIQKQVQATTAAIQLNIQQVKSIKSQMEEKLPKVLSEITSLQKIREDLHVAIKKNTDFLSMTQTRLALRRQRPGKEQCGDPAQVQLLAQVQQLTASINKLRKEVAQSEQEQRMLVLCQVKLQESIDIKAKRLYIDEVVCMQLREPVVMYDF